MTQPEPVPVTIQPYYVRRRQDWAVEQERMRHRQAMLQVGEPALFTLMWKQEDFEAGLIGRCPRCRTDPGTIEGRIQQVYKQPLNARCPVCYGTTFDGGIRAQIIRPTVFTDTDEDEKKSGRGVIHPETAMVESTSDFRSRTGDYVFRKDGSRWQLGTPRRVMVRTGYEHPTQAESSVGYSQITATREDESSVAFILPPSTFELSVFLDNTDSPFPEPPPYQVINGPLIPQTEFE